VAPDVFGRVLNQETKQWIHGAQIYFAGLEKVATFSDSLGVFAIDAQYIRRPVQVFGADGDMFKPAYHWSIVIKCQGFRTTKVLLQDFVYKSWNQNITEQSDINAGVIELQEAERSDEPLLVVRASFFADDPSEVATARWLRFEPMLQEDAGRDYFEFRVLDARAGSRHTSGNYGFDYPDLVLKCIVVKSSVREYKPGLSFEIGVQDWGLGSDSIQSAFLSLKKADRVSLSVKGILQRFGSEDCDSMLCTVSEIERANQPPLRMPVGGTPAACAPVAPPPGIAGR
jgi:hypothetical protein